MIEVDSNIPVPPRRAPNAKYPFDTMEVGDSFFVSNSDTSIKRLSSAANVYAARRDGLRFTVRRVEGGARCWRIA